MMPSKAVLSGDLWSRHGPYWNFFFLGFLFHLHFECRGPPWVKSSKEVKKYILKQNCINNSYRLENILCWNLVKSALDKEDSSVPVYSLFNFFYL